MSIYKVQKCCISKAVFPPSSHARAEVPPLLARLQSKKHAPHVKTSLSVPHFQSTTRPSALVKVVSVPCPPLRSRRSLTVYFYSCLSLVAFTNYAEVLGSRVTNSDKDSDARRDWRIDTSICRSRLISANAAVTSGLRVSPCPSSHNVQDTYRYFYSR